MEEKNYFEFFCNIFDRGDYDLFKLINLKYFLGVLCKSMIIERIVHPKFDFTGKHREYLNS